VALHWIEEVGMVSWLVFGIVMLFVLGGVALLFRSLRRWKTPPAGTTPEAQIAESELWSTRNFPSR
jgi:hypothetical protein